MTISELTETFETKFWLLLIPILDEGGPLMKILDFSKRMMRKKAGFLSMLFLIWAAVGFLFGLILGRMIWIFQTM